MNITGRIGRYNILRQLGTGGFGTVYLAEDLEVKDENSAALVALKIPHRIGLNSKKLIQEFNLQKKLSHPNIVKLDIFHKNIDNNVVMVMEFIKGKDLEEIIDAKGTIDIVIALKYFKQILNGISFAHQHKILHRDIRPSNILIDSYDNVKITDFGISKSLENLTHAKTKIGSPPYMAPEQFEEKTVYASDIYSCGVLFYEMVSGFPPIVSVSPIEIYKKAKAGDIESLIRKVPIINKELNRIIMKALAPRVENRYKNIDELIYDIQKYESPKKINHSEISIIKERINIATNNRKDTLCWSCRKSIPSNNYKCPYCGEEL